jgi:hypothetical protein
VDEFSTGVYHVERFAGGTYVNGVWTKSGESTFDIKALIIPAGGAELLRLPEGERMKETFKVLSVSELKAAGADVGAPDRITLPRGIFEVKTIDDFTAAAGFYVYVAQRVDRGD